MKANKAKIISMVLILLLSGCGNENHIETEKIIVEENQVTIESKEDFPIEETTENIADIVEEEPIKQERDNELDSETEVTEIEKSYKKFGFSSTDENEIKVYYDTICRIDSTDYFCVTGYELAYFDDDNIPELIISVLTPIHDLFIYTVKNGEVVPYNVGDNWFTMAIDSDIQNDINLGHGNGYQIKEASYIPYSGKLHYFYSEEGIYSEDGYSENITTEYYFDGYTWYIVRETGYYFADDAGNQYKYDSEEVTNGLAKKVWYDNIIDVPNYDHNAEWTDLLFSYHKEWDDR